jgi:xylan 1,4-beta-xylosidase
VRQWFFEVWNEPNLKDFWAGSQADYFELYRHSVGAIKDVDSGLRVGGPATAKEEWLEEFLAFCDRNRLPADFVSTHHYPNDVLWYENQDTETQLAHSRRGILGEWTREARRRVGGSRPLFYTEWNCSSNPRYPPQDEPYAAAFAVKTILEAAGLVECYSFWTFSDIFEENYFPSVPFHGGFGLLNLHGIPKPTYHAFALLHRLGSVSPPVDGIANPPSSGEMVAVRGCHETVDAWVIRGPGSAQVILTNHALPRHPIEAAQVGVRLQGAPRPRAVFLERIDQDHANAKRLWQEMGEPEYLTEPEVARLQEGSRLVREPQAWKDQGQGIDLEIPLPAHAVAAITVEFSSESGSANA